MSGEREGLRLCLCLEEQPRHRQYHTGCNDIAWIRIYTVLGMAATLLLGRSPPGDVLLRFLKGDDGR